MNFNNLVDSTELAEQQDSLGGRYFFPSDVYEALVSCAYLTESKSGATAVVLDLKIQGKDYRETIYITNRNGENFYVRDGIKQGLPGWNLMDALSILSLGKGFMQTLANRPEKMVKVYDFEQKKEVPTNLPVLEDLLNAKVKVGIVHQIVNKTEQNSQGEYVPVDDVKEENVISAVFSPDTDRTLAETKKDLEPEFINNWLKKYKTGAPYDRSKKTGNTPSSDRSGTKREVKKVDRTKLFGA